MSNPRVRFAPSPTGYLHIGGARTALFNWLFAKQNNGKFLLRIEDTDLERSKEEYINQITDALEWLGLNWDEDIILQSKNNERHQEMVSKMLQNGTAYKCFLQKEELDELREKSEAKKEIFRVPKTYRNLQADQVNKQELIAALKMLDDRSKDILQRRYLSDKKATLHDLADEYEVSAERIRQIENSALKKLKSLMVDFA